MKNYEPNVNVGELQIMTVKDSSLLYKDCTIRSPEDGYILFKPFLGELDREYFVVMSLDVKNSGVSACALRNIDGN